MNLKKLVVWNESVKLASFMCVTLSRAVKKRMGEKRYLPTVNKLMWQVRGNISYFQGLLRCFMHQVTSNIGQQLMWVLCFSFLSLSLSLSLSLTCSRLIPPQTTISLRPPRLPEWVINMYIGWWRPPSTLPPTSPLVGKSQGDPLFWIQTLPFPA